MSCKLDLNLIQGYLDDTLNPVEKIIVEEHLNVCETCRKELTEMKLLFYELDRLEDSQIDIPDEVSQLRSKVVSDICSTTTDSYGIKEFMNTQKQIAQKAGIFLQFVPGMKFGAVCVEKGIKKTPSLLYKAAEAAFIGGRKLTLARAKA